MSLLTAREKEACKGMVNDPEAIETAEVKLKEFQAKLTSKLHVAKINKLIPLAEAVANMKTKMLDDGQVDEFHRSKIFHREMNRLKKKAKLIK